jgi:hypothetical protein
MKPTILHPEVTAMMNDPPKRQSMSRMFTLRFGASHVSHGSFLLLVSIVDTMMHQLGIDHLKLASHHSGRDYRLTGVHGEVVNEIRV